MQGEQEASKEQAEKSTNKTAFPLFLSRESLHSFLRPFVEHLFQIDVKGLENIPEKGPAILLCKHTGYLGIIIQFVYSNSKLDFLVKKNQFRFLDKLQMSLSKKDSPIPNLSSSVKNLIKLLGNNLPLISTFLEKSLMAWGIQTVEGESHKIEEKMRKILDKGSILSIFSDSTRPDIGKADSFQSIALQLALQMQIPIIPSGMGGTYDLFTLEALLSGQAFRTLVPYGVGEAIFPEEFFKKKGQSQNEEKKMIHLLNASLEKEMHSLSQGPAKEGKL